MSTTTLEKTQSQPQSSQAQVRKSTPLEEYVSLIFVEPEYVIEPTESKLSIPLHTVTMDKITEHLRVSHEKTTVSKFGLQHMLSADEIATPFPKWEYRSVDSAPMISDVVGKLMDVLKGHSYYTVATKTAEFTTVPNSPFRVSEQLLQAVEKATTVKVAYLTNSVGGVDILASVESASERGKAYGVSIYVGPIDGKSETSVPTINFACTCPVGQSRGVACKHVLAVLTASPHIVFGALDHVASGKANKLDYYVEYWRERFTNLFSEAKTDVEKAAYVYYLTKFLHSKGLLRKVTGAEINGVLNDFVSAVSNGSVDKWLQDNNYLTVQETKTEVRTHELVASGALAKIKWTPEMERIRDKIEHVIKDITYRFGTMDEKGGEWQTLLAFGMVMSSLVSPTRPPIVLHAIGDIGTFKTTGARLISQYIELPVLAVSYRGSNVVDKYRDLLNLLSKHFGIPTPEIENKVGGVIAHLQPYKDGFVAFLSLQYLYSNAANTGNPSQVKQFVEDLVKNGFTVETRTVKPKSVVLDPAQLSNIEDYRMKYLPDENLGIITQMDAFDNYVVVVDEGCRNLHGLEALLTKMSISTTNEGVRMIIVTDNLDPFMESVRNPRYGPFHDRTFKAITKSIRDESVVSEHLHKPPEVKLNVLELMAAERFIENIPIMPGFIPLAKAVSYALTYKYTIVSLKKGVKHIRPLSRDEKADIELDAFAGSNFKFIAGSRFIHHTLTLSKFFAFMNKHDHVTLDDFTNALMVTVKSRLITDATTTRDYKMSVVDVVSNLKRMLADTETYVDKVLKFAALLESGDVQKISVEFDKLTKEGNQEPFILSLTLATLEHMLSLNKIKFDKLPDNVKYTLVELKIEKDDIFGLEPVMHIVDEIRRSKHKEVK